ncbi:DUF7226 domain-containing protein [Leuconostoc falkenbergense]
MSKVLELMMILKRRPLTKTEIAENFNFDPRQSDYYVKNILMYFGLAEQIDSRFKLTVRGKHIAQQAVGQRNILLAREIISYSLFNHLIQRRIIHGRLNKKDIIHEMLIEDLGLSISTVERRASTVNAIIEWIMLQILD